MSEQAQPVNEFAEREISMAESGAAAEIYRERSADLRCCGPPWTARNAVRRQPLAAAEDEVNEPQPRSQESKSCGRHERPSPLDGRVRQYRPHSFRAFSQSAYCEYV